MKKTVPSILTIGMFIFGAYKVVAQCTCAPVSVQFRFIDAVFAGKVIEVKKVNHTNTDSDDIVIKFEVKQTWKQNLERFVIVRKVSQGPDEFEPNSEWLVYAYKNKDGTFSLNSSCCSLTRRLSESAEDVKIFRKMGKKPKKIIENKV